MLRAKLLSLDIVQVVSNKAVGQHINSLVKGRNYASLKENLNHMFYKKIPFKWSNGYT